MRATRTIVGVVVAVVGIGAAVAEAGKIYWTEQGKICRANLDMSAREDSLISGLGQPKKIALDLNGGKVYWADFSTNKIQRANLDGSDVKDLVTGADARQAVAIALDLDAGKMYWSYYPINPTVDFVRMKRANLDGTNVEAVQIEGEWDYWGVKVAEIMIEPSAGKIYWSRSGNIAISSIRRADLDGSNVEELVDFPMAGHSPSGIGLDLVNSKIYWSDFDHNPAVARASLSPPRDPEPLITPGDTLNMAIALDVENQLMYWVNHSAAAIYRAPMEPDPLIETILVGIYESDGIALDLRDDNPIPAVSTWGVVIMTLLVLTLGTVVITNQQRRQQAFV